MKPGQPGTKRWMEKFGDKLFCVRYRYDEAQRRKLITVEIIVDESPWQKKVNRTPPNNKIVLIRVGYEESYLRNLVKSAGGKWNQKKKVWELPYQEVINLGLANRMVSV